MWHIFGGDADAAVLDADGDRFVVAGDVYDYFPVGRVLDGVFDQVRNNFAEVVGIDVGVVGWLDSGGGVRTEGADEAFFGGTWCQALKNLADKGGDIDDLRLILEAAIFGAADVEQILEQSTQVLGRGVGLGDEIARLVVDVGGGWVERQAEVALDGGDGSAHFVTGGRDEFGLLALLGFFLGDVAKNDDDAFVVFTDWRGDDGDEDLLVRGGAEE